MCTVVRVHSASGSRSNRSTFNPFLIMLEPSKHFPGKFTYSKPCSPSDYYRGGKCHREGCYKPRPRIRRPFYSYRNPRP